jgi:hypothetical protein
MLGHQVGSIPISQFANCWHPSRQNLRDIARTG